MPMVNAFAPDTRTMETAPLPGGVANAAIVSSYTKDPVLRSHGGLQSHYPDGTKSFSQPR